MMLAFGVMAALWERNRSGLGQVVDASILDGSALLATGFHGFYQTGLWDHTRHGVNLVDGGCPYYDCYLTADGGYVAVGALEEKFYAELLGVLGIDPGTMPDRDDRANWPAIRERFTEVIATRTRSDWAEAATGTDACLEPVLTMDEVRHEPHNAARGVLEFVDGLWQPTPAPRFSRTPPLPLSGR
jgi:alpha-methylacyl-CoA racemase